MDLFQTKRLPDEQKLRGGFYTPELVGKYIAKWVASRPGHFLEPSCGDGAILKMIPKEIGFKVTAVEINSIEAIKAKQVSGWSIQNIDFFSWFSTKHINSFDGVLGNPPYIRFGNWETTSRDRAFNLLKSEGIKPNKLTNAWLPFVVASLMAVRENGRVALVVPAELLQVSYASAVRSYLIDNCSNIKIVSFKELVFPGIQQEVVLLFLVKGAGPAKIQTFEVKDSQELQNLDLNSTESVRGELHDGEKWTKYYLDSESINFLRKVRNSFHRFGDFAEVQVGVVTGCNDFFCLSFSDATRRGLVPFTIPIVTRGNQLSGLRLTSVDFKSLEASTGRTRLLELNNFSASKLPASLKNYIQAGEAQELHLGYKCRIRENWWQVPSIWQPDGFMLRQIHKYPRAYVNEIGATSTDTVHRVRLTGEHSMDALSVALLNSATLTWGELHGRSYGGGVLELEPSEARGLPIPHPKFIGKTLIKRVESLLKREQTDDAIALVDQEVLIKKLGIGTQDIARLNSNWQMLSERRLNRK